MTFENQFGRYERLLHRFAFRTGFSQVMLADIENAVFAEAIEAVTLDHPVFISGLPRSGTTILHRLLNDTGHFATQTYQDMPFVLCPLLWSRFSRHFAVDPTPRERAHGDGIAISTHSPAALEEIVWKQFWPGHYQHDRIEPWRASDSNEEFKAFFESYMAKIVAARQNKASRSLRYLSKNNVNIARLTQEPLRRGTFIVPFRDPLQHAASMLLQHQRFSKLQAEDPFVLKYMEGIGHYDFGLGLRPINFGSWLEEAGSSTGIEFWVRYWNAAYRHVLAGPRASIRLVSYRQLTSDSKSALWELADATQAPAVALLKQVDRLRPPREHAVRLRNVSRKVRDEALHIYDELQQVHGAQASLAMTRADCD